MFRARILTAAIALPVALVVLYLGGLWLSALTALLAVVAANEYYWAAFRKHYLPSLWVGYLLAATLALSSYRLGWASFAEVYAFVLALGTLAVWLTSLMERRRGEALGGTATTLFGAIATGGLLTFLPAIRGLPLASGSAKPLLFAGRPGFWYVLAVIAACWLMDTAAYLVGSQFGRTKLAPTISAGKTVEGSAAGLGAAIVGAVLFGWPGGLPPGHCLIIGCICGVIGQLGDLSKSTFKREVGIKDFGSLFPGHGGVLDRFDSLLFSLPLCYYYLHWVVR